MTTPNPSNRTIVEVRDALIRLEQRRINVYNFKKVLKVKHVNYVLEHEGLSDVYQIFLISGPQLINQLFTIILDLYLSGLLVILVNMLPQLLILFHRVLAKGKA